MLDGKVRCYDQESEDNRFKELNTYYKCVCNLSHYLLVDLTINSYNFLLLPTYHNI